MAYDITFWISIEVFMPENGEYFGLFLFMIGNLVVNGNL